MPVYKFTDGRKGWYFQGYYNGKKYKKERWQGKHLDTKNAAIIAEREFLEDKEHEEAKKQGKITLYELFDLYVSSSKASLKISSKAKYDQFKRLYLSLLPDKLIFELSGEDILEWRNKLCKLNIGVNNINRHLNIMKNFLNFGTLMYNLPGSLQYSLLEPHKSDKIEDVNEKSDYITKEDFEKMISFLDISIPNQFYYYTVLYVLYNTGLRIGELAALTPEDYKNDYLNINKTYSRVGGVDYVLPPKTANSIRKVALDNKTSNLIKDYIERIKPSGRLFSLKADFLKHQLLGRVMKKLGVLANVDSKYNLHPHVLRHSHASNLRKLGFDEYVIAKRLGNTPTVSANTYIHSSEEDENKLILALNNS